MQYWPTSYSPLHFADMQLSSALHSHYTTLSLHHTLTTPHSHYITLSLHHTLTTSHSLHYNLHITTLHYNANLFYCNINCSDVLCIYVYLCICGLLNILCYTELSCMQDTHVSIMSDCSILIYIYIYIILT